MFKRTLYPILMLILMVFASACNGIFPITGSKNIISENRDVSGFSGIDVSLSAEIILIQGDTESLSIEADDNIMTHIQTAVQNGVLDISMTPNMTITPSQPIKITVSFIALTSINTSGSTTITANGLSLETLTLDTSGSTNIVATDVRLDTLTIDSSGTSQVQLSGTVSSQTIEITGNGVINNFELVSDTTSIDVSGNGQVFVNVADTLDVDISGNSEISYMGSPLVTRNITGNGTITQVEP
jgi:hypothetical protein